MITLQRIRELSLLHPAQPGRPAFITAASGLVIWDDRFFVAADDEFHLAEFSLSRPREPGRLHRLMEGALPAEPKTRKKEKPDFEALVRFPCQDGDGLLTIPSGSRPNRRRGAIVPILPQGVGSVRTVDFTPLYSRLEEQIPGLNLEGAVVSDTHLRLFHRGNTAQSFNAVIDLALDAVHEDLSRGEISARGIERVTRLQLGDIQGVGLTLTDATLAQSGDCYFVAVAEDTEDAYHDGRVVGSVLGRLSADGQVMDLQVLSLPLKIEGIAWAATGVASHRLYGVTDDDDPSRPSSLWSLTDPRI